MNRILSVIISLLIKFSFELSIDFLQPLILSKRNDIIRLKKIENYIFMRQNGFSDFFASIFADLLRVEISYFISLYYNASNKHKNLRQKITANAIKRKVAKKIE